MKKQILAFIVFTMVTINTNYSYNPEHLRIFLKGDNVMWVKWRKKNPQIKPDLSRAVINNFVFSGDYSNTNFQYTKIGDVILGNSNFTGANFSYGTLKNLKCPVTSHDITSYFVNTVLYKVKIKNSLFLRSEFDKTNFIEAEIYNTSITYSTFKHVSFVKARIVESKLDNTFFDVDFSYARIDKTLILSYSFFNNRMAKVKFNFAKVYKSIFVNNLTDVSFIDADLTESSFYYDKLENGTTLTNVNFTNANLTNVNFTDAKFQNVIFKNADMTGAKLERKWYSYVKKQGVRNFDKIQWM